MRNRFIKYSLIALGLIIGLSSCLDLEEYDTIDTLQKAPVATVTIDEVKQDAVVFTVGSNTAGSVSFILLEGEVTEVPDGEDLLTLNIGGVVEEGSIMLEGEARSYSFTIGGQGKELDNNATYTLFAVAGNTDGIWSEVVSQVIKTDDETIPTLKSVSPEVTNNPEVAVDAVFTLTFSEPVILDATKKFTIGYYEEDIEMEIPVDSITVEGNKVTLKQPRIAAHNVLIYLSYEAGVVTDLVGNPVKEMISGVIDDALEGLYFITEQEPFAIDVTKFTPEVQKGHSDLSSISIEFEKDVFVKSDFEEGDISMTIYGVEDGTSYKKTYALTANFVSTTGMVATITLPKVPDFGEKVALSIGEGVLVDVYGNPVEAMESDDAEGAWWLRSYNRDINVLVGSYTVTATSYFDDLETVENLTVALDPENADQVIITGFMGSDVQVSAKFDKDFSTLEIIEPEDAVVTVEGSYMIWLAYPSNWPPMIAFVDANGDTSVPFGYYYEDLVGSGSGWYDIFRTTIWEKDITPPSAGLKSGFKIDVNKKLHKL